MAENEQKQQQPRQYQEDEIDLRKLFQAIGSFFENFWSWIINIIIAIRRATLSNIVLFTILIIAGGIAGYFSVTISEPYYRSSMILRSNVFRGLVIESSIEKLNLLCRDADRKELSMALGLPIEVALNVRGFEAIPFVSEDEITELEVLKEQLKNLNVNEAQTNQLLAIQDENKSTYEIAALVYKTETISQLEEPLLNYFRQNPYVKKRLEITRLNREKKKEKIQNEAKKLDSLKSVIYKNLSRLANRSKEGSNNVILADDNMTNPLTIILQDLDLYDEELAIERQLILEEELEVVDGFTTFSSPAGPGRNLAMRSYILYAIGLGYLFLLLRSINTYLSRVEKEQKNEDSV